MKIIESEGNSMQQLATTQPNLGQKELTAIQMKCAGMTSREIAKAIGYNESSVRRLFMAGGRLEKAYHAFLELLQQETKDIAKLLLERVNFEAPGAIERIIKLSKESNDALSFKASGYLISMIGAPQDNSVRAMLKGMSYEQARKKLDEVFKEVFDKSLFADWGRVVFVTKAYHCEHCGKDVTERETGSEDHRSEEFRSRQERASGTPPNP